MIKLIRAIVIYAISSTLLISCTNHKEEEKPSLNDIAEHYVKLVLEIGQYDGDFVDAYYGPEEWKPSSEPIEERDDIPTEVFIQRCHKLHQQLNKIDTSQWRKAEQLRHTMLIKQIHAVATKVKILGGEVIPFDNEAVALYDASPPHNEESYFDSLLEKLNNKLPGEGALAERYEAFSKDFVIPKDKLDTVFQVAITEARLRTNQHYDLPDNENFTIEYVTDKAWSGYNYYKGNAYSLIQINTDFPIFIERAIDLACHEGYPGHHVFNAMLEKNLVVEKGWKEFSVYPLFSPQSLIAEGSANYGIEVAFPGDERLRFDKEFLFPLAGLDSSKAQLYYDIQELRSKLDYAGNEAARKYLDGEISRNKAAEWLTKYLLYEPDRALQRTRFFDKYRSYVINYNLGKDIVAEYVESRGGTIENPERRWEVFAELLSTPRTASLLQTDNN